jgi:hypothetical protein
MKKIIAFVVLLLPCSNSAIGVMETFLGWTFIAGISIGGTIFACCECVEAGYCKFCNSDHQPSETSRLVRRTDQFREAIAEPINHQPVSHQASIEYSKEGAS